MGPNLISLYPRLQTSIYQHYQRRTRYGSGGFKSIYRDSLVDHLIAEEEYGMTMFAEYVIVNPSIYDEQINHFSNPIVDVLAQQMVSMGSYAAQVGYVDDDGDIEVHITAPVVQPVNHIQVSGSYMNMDQVNANGTFYGSGHFGNIGENE